MGKRLTIALLVLSAVVLPLAGLFLFLQPRSRIVAYTAELHVVLGSTCGLTRNLRTT